MAVKAIVEKPTFYVKYFRQRLLSLVNMGLHTAIIRLSPLLHEGEQRRTAWRSTWQSGEKPLWPPLWKILDTPLFESLIDYANVTLLKQMFKTITKHFNSSSFLAKLICYFNKTVQYHIYSSVCTNLHHIALSKFEANPFFTV